jgi:uncharacterized protein YeaO (DUF488 family)
MLSRYQIKRAAKLSSLPREVQKGIRQDTRKHTRHVLRPPGELVLGFLADPNAAGAFQRFAKGYCATLEQRFKRERGKFDELAQAARKGNVFIGCSCPTTKNPSVLHCHTWLALEFMHAKYPDLDVRFPS